MGEMQRDTAEKPAKAIGIEASAEESRNANAAAPPDPEHARSAAMPVRKFEPSADGFRWQDTPLKQYKPAGTHFKDITRQILFGEEEQMPTQLRYFEIAPDGHSTLEQHEHVHAVLILSGRGRVLVGDAIHDVAPFDLVHVPPLTWHQFRAAAEESLGFLCLVACDRDRPRRPDSSDAEMLSSIPGVGDFIRL